MNDTPDRKLTKNGNAHLAMSDSMDTAITEKEILFHGIPSAPGIAIGRVFFLKSKLHDFTPHINVVPLSEEQTQEQLAKLQHAVQCVESELDSLKKKMEAEGQNTDADIFSAQRMFLSDKNFMARIVNIVNEKHWPVEEAINITVSELSTSFALLDDDYFKERIADIKDVAGRILANMVEVQKQSPREMPEDCIMIAEDILPSQLAQLNLKATKGIIMKSGSKTCHVAILAQSLEIPTITGLQSILATAKDGDELLLDGYLGLAILHPIQETLEYYKAKISRKDQIRHNLFQEIADPTDTLDAVSCKIEANLGNLEDCVFALKNHASGVGLFRTEFLYMNSKTMPDEETQYRIYCELLHAMRGKPVTIRTFDFGGDKTTEVCKFKESNPFLGMRAIRLHREMPELLRTQLRALLRAGTEGDLRIMFPMVTTMHEIDEILTLKNELVDYLEYKQIPFNRSVKLGVMIEIPSAAIMADAFAEKVDFFSIGTNDLVQYTLAVDRTNDKVQHLFRPCHPAVMRLIKIVADAAKHHNIEVAVCGEMAGNPLFAPLLLGLGIRHLSMSPNSMPVIGGLIRRMAIADAESLAAFALESHYTEPIIAHSKDFIRNSAPDIFTLIN